MDMFKLVTRAGVCLFAAAAGATDSSEILGTYYLNGGLESWHTNCTYWKLGSVNGEPATEAVNSKYNYVHINASRMKGPDATEEGYKEYVFNGNSLILECNSINNGFLLRNGVDQTITFANEGLIFNKTAYLGSWSKGNADIHGKITVNSGAQMGIFESGSKGKAFTFHDKFYGSGTVHVYSQLNKDYDASQSFTFTANFLYGVLSEFTGTVKVSWGQSYTSSQYTSATKGVIGLNGGNFPGSVEVAVGGVLESAGTNTIGGNLNLLTGSTLRFAEQPTSETEPVLSVSQGLTIADTVDVELPAQEKTLSEIIVAITNDNPAGVYTMGTKSGVLLRGPEGTTLDPDKFDFGTVDPVVPGSVEFDGRDLKYGPDLKRYVLGNGFRTTTGGTGSESDDMTNVVRWSDGKAPDDPDTGYILVGKLIRTPDRYKTGSEDHRSVFAGGALITKGTCTLFEKNSGFVCDDLRVMDGTFRISDNGSEGWVDKFWDNDFICYTDAGDKSELILQKAISFDGNYGIASAAYLSFMPYCLATPAWDIRANLYGSGRVNSTLRQHNSGGLIYNYGSMVMRFSGDNSKFYGRMIFDSDVYADDCRTHAWFTRKEAFGGARASMMMNALHFGRNTALHIPSNSVITVDQANLGFYLTGNTAAQTNGNLGFVEFDVGENSVFTLKEQLTFDNALRKTGSGTFAFGGTLKFCVAKDEYSDDPVAGVTDGTNVLTVAEGSFRALTTDAVDGLEIRFEEGAGLEVEVTENVTDGIGRYGIVNNWSVPFVLPESGIRVTVKDPENILENMPKASRKVAIATLPTDKASALRGKMSGAMAAPGSRFISAAIEESDNGDGTVTFYAVPHQLKFVLLFR